MPIELDADALMVFLRREFPQVAEDFAIESVAEDELVVRLKVADKHLRPGGTVSGPTMFALADVGLYLAILSRMGPVGLAVTTNCAIDFMRKPAAGVDLLSRTRILKMGRLLVVGDVMIEADGDPRPVARASLTYSIPPRG